FAKYKLHFDKTERGYLTKEELNVLAYKTFSIERLQSVLDMFLFSCYTGLAYIDMSNLTRGNIVKGIDGGDWLVTNRQKTETVVKVPLLPQASALIDKYNDHPKACNSERLFPVIYNQRISCYLMEIADVCVICKTLIFHIARHTFVTTVTLSNAVPKESENKMLGHTIY